MQEKRDVIDTYSTDKVQLYGPYLAGAHGSQDYSLPIKLHGVRIVNENWLRELVASHAALLQAVETAVPFVEDHETTECYKPGAVKKTVKRMRILIERALKVAS